jgi:hypothetical protein
MIEDAFERISVLIALRRASEAGPVIGKDYTSFSKVVVQCSRPHARWDRQAPKTSPRRLCRVVSALARGQRRTGVDHFASAPDTARAKAEERGAIAGGPEGRVPPADIEGRGRGREYVDAGGDHEGDPYR